MIRASGPVPESQGFFRYKTVFGIGICSGNYFADKDAIDAYTPIRGAFAISCPEL